MVPAGAAPRAGVAVGVQHGDFARRAGGDFAYDRRAGREFANCRVHCIRWRGEQQHVVFAAIQREVKPIGRENLLQSRFNRYLLGPQSGADPAGGAQFAQVVGQAVADVHGGADAGGGEYFALGDVGTRAAVPVNQGFHHLSLLVRRVQHGAQAGGGAAHRPGYGHLVPRLGGGAQRRLSGGDAGQGHGDEGHRGAHHVAADDARPELPANFGHAGVQLFDGGDLRVRRQPQGDKSKTRLAAHGRHIADVGGDGFPAQVEPRRGSGGEVDAVHHGIGSVQFGDRGVPKGNCRRIVAVVHRQLELGVGRRIGRLGPTLHQRDKAEFAQFGDAHKPGEPIFAV